MQNTRVYPPCNLPDSRFPRSRAGVFLGFTLHNQSLAKSQHHTLSYASTGGFLGFKVHCHSKTLTFPNRVNGRKKSRYGGVLPSVLRSLESNNDIEKTLGEISETLSPKEQTVILKEQKNWERVVRVFDWFKARKDYAPNVIHYNIILRSLGRAQKWDELRLRWIEMARNGVLPTNNTYSMLVDVYGKSGLVREALLWIKHMRVRGMFPDEVTMNTVIRVLKDGREYDRAHGFYKDWCDGRVDLDDLELDDHDADPMIHSFKHFLSTELFRIGGRSTNLHTEASAPKQPRLTSTFNTLIDLYGKAGRLDDAANVFGEMLRSGVVMDTITFNTMIFTCGTHGHMSEAEALLAKMEERGVNPDTKTYNIFLSLYAEAGEINRALDCYNKIREVGLYPDMVTHRTVLHVLCQRNMVQEVERVIKDMDDSNSRIDEHSVPGIVKMYVENGLLDKAKSFYETSQRNGRLSAKTYAAIIDAYAEKRLWVEAEGVFFGDRGSVNQKPNVVEYNVMIKVYGMANLYDKALSLFDGMRNHGTWPDDCTYNSLIQMLAKGDFVIRARELLGEMQGTGIKPNCVTFSALIASYARLGDLTEAVNIFRNMLTSGVKPNEVVYGALVNGFAESGRVEEALSFLRRMEDSGISANQIVLTSLIKAYGKVGCLEGAKSIYERMRLFKGGPDIIASNSMINLYAILGMVSEANQVFIDLRQKNITDEVSFATMMNLYKSNGMFNEAVKVAEEMKNAGLVKDCASFTMVMSCYCASGVLGKSGAVLHEMLARKILPDTWTFRVLFTVLKKSAFSIEAVTQLERSYEDGKPYSRQAVFTSVFSVVGMHDLALEFCDVFTKTEVNLDVVLYNVAIYAYGSAGKIERALNMFLRMQDEKVDPDEVTYMNLVFCYGKAGMVEGVKRVFSQLKNDEIEQSGSLYETIIDAFETANRPDLADLASQEMRFALGSGRVASFETRDEFHPSSELEN